MNAIALSTLKWCSTVCINGECITTVLKQNTISIREHFYRNRFTQSKSCRIVTLPCDAAKCNSEELISSFESFRCAKIRITLWRSSFCIASIRVCLRRLIGMVNGGRKSFCSYLSRIHRSRSDLNQSDNSFVCFFL